MIDLAYDTSTDQVRLVRAVTIKAGSPGVPVRLTFSSVPTKTVSDIQIALGTEGASPTVLAFNEEFTAESSTVWTAILDANDTRLVNYMNGRKQADTNAELVLFLDGERQAYQNITVTVQPPIVNGPETTEGGPVYLTESNADGLYLSVASDQPLTDEQKQQGRENLTAAPATFISSKDHGAIGDGLNHPVSQWLIGGALDRGYANLAAIQVDYPHVTSLSDEIDWAAIQKALLVTAATGVGGQVVIPSGYYLLNKTLKIYGRGVSILGAGQFATWLEMTDAAADGMRFEYKDNISAGLNQPLWTRLQGFTLRAARSGTSTGFGINTRYPDDTEIFWMYGLHMEQVNVFAFNSCFLGANLCDLLMQSCSFGSHGTCLEFAKCDTFYVYNCLCNNGWDDIDGLHYFNTTGTCIVMRNNNSGPTIRGNLASCIEGGDWGNAAKFLDMQSGHLHIRNLNCESIYGSAAITHSGGSLTLDGNRFVNSNAVATDAVILMTSQDAYLRERDTILEDVWQPIIYKGDDFYNSNIDSRLPVIWQNAAGTEQQRSPGSTFEPKSASFWASIFNPITHLGKVFFKPRFGSFPSDFVASRDNGDGTGKTSSILNCNVAEKLAVGTYLSSAAGGSETALHTTTVSGNRLGVTAGDAVRFTASGKFAANGNTKRVRVTVAGTVGIDSGAVTLNDKMWSIEGTITCLDGFDLWLDFTLKTEGGSVSINCVLRTIDLSAPFDVVLLTTGTAAADVTATLVKTTFEL